MSLVISPRRGLFRNPLGLLILLAAVAIQPAWSWKCAMIGAGIGAALGTGVGALAHCSQGNVGEGMAEGSAGAVPGFIIGGLLCGEKEAAAAPAAPAAAAAAAEVQPIGIVYFDFDKYNIRADQQPVVDDVASKMSADPNLRVSLEGHCDAIGSDEYNLSLGERRSSSVQRGLEEKGVAADRMTTKSWGEERPAAPNTNPDGSDNPDGRAKNRRCEIIPIQ
jgi:outer membrane protein OmpA-like peptidoglycan-associated protein